MRRLAVFLSLLVGSVAPSPAQLTTDQRIHDFQELAAAFNQYYAPGAWKQVALGVNLLDVRSYLDRIRNAATDAEYFEICMEYVASLEDGHAGFTINSTYTASLGMAVDIFDGRALIEAVDRSRYPVGQFPFGIGDELVSLDGVAVDDILARLARLQSLGNDRPTRRLAAYHLTSRPQAAIPSAYLLPDTTTAVIRRAETDALESYTLSWRKTGTPLINLPRLPDLITNSASKAKGPSALAAAPSNDERLRHMLRYDRRMARAYGRDMEQEYTNENGETIRRNALAGMGARMPFYSLPDGFVRRRGTSFDELFSGTYTVDGVRIGLIRIPSFDYAIGFERAWFIDEYQTEINYMQQNTDGLVIDVTRNPGGYCSADVAGRLIPREFPIYQQQLRPTLMEQEEYAYYLNMAPSSGAPPWVVTMYSYIVDSLRLSAEQVRGLTAPLPSCWTYDFSSFPVPVNTYKPPINQAGEFAGYSKPFIVLMDDLSASQAEHFASIIQDNQRAPIVGVRSPGLGGGTSSLGSSAYGQSGIAMTFTLSVRNMVAEAPGLPPGPYIESIGVIPDIALDPMTRENLMNGYRPFVTGFTQILIDRVRQAGGQ